MLKLVAIGEPSAWASQLGPAYGPMIVNVPVAISLIRQELAERYVTPASLARGGVAITALMALQIPLLFRLGRHFLDNRT